MTPQELQDKAAELFPLPDKTKFIYGESYAIEAAIVLGKREIWIAGANYVLENSKKD